MTAAVMLCEWFLARLGEARAAELLREEKAQRKLVRMHRKAAAKKLRRQRNAERKATRGHEEPETPLTSDALESFLSKGWSYRTAAKQLDVSATHVHRVLCGERPSRSLLARVVALPTRKETAL